MAFAHLMSLGHKWQKGRITGNGLYLGVCWDRTGTSIKLLTFYFWDSTKLTNNRPKLKHGVTMVHVTSYGEGIRRKTWETVLGSEAHKWISYSAECGGFWWVRLIHDPPLCLCEKRVVFDHLTRTTQVWERSSSAKAKPNVVVRIGKGWWVGRNNRICCRQFCFVSNFPCGVVEEVGLGKCPAFATFDSGSVTSLKLQVEGFRV